jgi:pyruvate/2-oxoacid:ferredoxin oxidoreductase beta subunit
MAGFLDTSKSFPHCPGCGHPHILRSLDEAMTKLSLDPKQVVLVTDIGCVGLADFMFPTVNTVHTLHGRSVAVATGLHLGDHASGREEPFKAIVLIGDGGAGLGLLHFVHAAQMNVDVTVLLHNNLLYGMTGGQHSVTTYMGMKTVTTPAGSPIPPLDLGAILLGAGAGFFARTIAPGDDVAGLIAEAVEHPGFACVEILELCPTFASRREGLTMKGLKALPELTDRPLGILRKDTKRPPFFKALGSTPVAERKPGEEGIEPDRSLRKLDRAAQIVVAGRAGEHVQTAASVTATAAAACGLYATIRSDNPVTQGTGFSIAELNLSPEPVAYTGLRNPDAVIVTAPEGLKELESRGLLKGPGQAKRWILDRSLNDPSIAAERVDLRGRFGPRQAALGALIEEISRQGWWDRRAWSLAFGRLSDKQRIEAEGLLEKIETQRKS